MCPAEPPHEDTGEALRPILHIEKSSFTKSNQEEVQRFWSTLGKTSQSTLTRAIVVRSTMSVVEEKYLEEYVGNMQLPDMADERLNIELRERLLSILRSTPDSSIVQSLKFQDDAKNLITLERVMLRHWRTPSGELAIALAYASDQRTGRDNQDDAEKSQEDLSQWLDFKLKHEIIAKSDVKELPDPEL